MLPCTTPWPTGRSATCWSSCAPAGSPTNPGRSSPWPPRPILATLGYGLFLAAGVPVAAICGATAGLARAGLLDERRHTSAAPEYLAATGYAGGDRYVDERAVVDGDLVTAGPQSPVQFARATLSRLGLASDETLEAYETVFHRGDRSWYPVLMQAGRPG